MNTTSTEKNKPLSVSDFITAVEGVRTEMLETMELWHKYISAHAEHPGMTPNMNLFIDPEGGIWAHGSTKNAVTGKEIRGFKRHNPNPSIRDRFFPSSDSKDFCVELPKGSRRGRYESWVWERPSRTSSAEALAETFKEIRTYQEYAESCRRSVIFANYLLKIPQSEIETWFKNRAETSDRKKDAHEDKAAFFEKFGKAAGFDDMEEAYGFLVNIVMKLQRLLDVLAGRAEIVRYY